MTERYSFAVDRHLVSNISVDGSVVWSPDNIDNTTLTDTINEGYVTAEDETQYLSVLDSTSEISLENLNITLTNPKLEVDENAETFIANEELMEQVPEEGNEQQVVVYSVEGSDELYGIQLAQDEEGNLQKYQFQFRKNKDGQLEAIPETIQLLPMEDGEVMEGNVENLEQHHEETVLENENVGVQHSMHIFVQEDNSNEHILPDRNTLEEQEESEENTEELYENENVEEVDIKPGILTLKQEIQEHLHQHAEPVDDETTESYPEENTTEYQPEVPENVEDQTLIEYNEHIDDTSIVSEENCNLSDDDESQEMAYATDDKGQKQTIIEENFEHIEVNPDMEVNQQQEEEENGQELEESDVDDNYQIVEGVHITGDVETAQPTDEPVIEKTIFNNTNILRHALRTNTEIRMKKDNRLYLYVVQHPEKENVDSLALGNLCKPLKANPRSILKSSFQARNENEGVLPTQNERLIGKRFARCKEAVQARIFHNFINKTTIPQAPVRKDRLPRKQKIKPVERMDEEIVVQEVMVSNNGFVETVGEGFNKENLEVTEYVELSDSDDDYDPKRTTMKKKKKHKRKKIEITISDDSEEDDDASSVIELDESEEDKPNENTPTKRRRGRPPKNRQESETTESPSKKSRPETTNTNPEKPEIPCPKCEKTFPSQNSLKTHLQHHSLQNSLKNALPEYKYKCESCATTFKNAILLKKHVCCTCTVCKKKFPDQTSLNAHKRIHAKEQLLKKTTLPPLSPKKGNSTFKSPKKMNSLKCKTCSKLCSSLQNLNIHMKTHREYVCATCSSKFLSQFALEKHLRENCVKSPKSARRSMRLAKSESDEETKNTTLKREVVGGGIRVTCDKCSMQFHSHQTLFKHKVKQHGLDTPDKSIFQGNNSKKTLHKEKKAFGGIPAAKKLHEAYSELRFQLDLDK